MKFLNSLLKVEEETITNFILHCSVHRTLLLHFLHYFKWSRCTLDSNIFDKISNKCNDTRRGEIYSRSLSILREKNNEIISAFPIKVKKWRWTLYSFTDPHSKADLHTMNRYTISYVAMCFTNVESLLVSNAVLAIWHSNIINNYYFLFILYYIYLFFNFITDYNQ